MARDDQDGGQFGRDARKHLRTTDQASMKRTAMDAKVGQLRKEQAAAESEESRKLSRVGTKSGKGSPYERMHKEVAREHGR